MNKKKWAVGLIISLSFVSYLLNVWGVRCPEGIGGSMYGKDAREQTIRDGQRCIFMKPWRKLRERDVVLFSTPLEAQYITLSTKRIARIQPGTGRLWLRGDNRENSFDSDSLGAHNPELGWVSQDRVVGLLVARLPSCFDGGGEQAIDGRSYLPVDEGLRRKKDSPPTVFHSSFPEVYVWLLRQPIVFQLRFVLGKGASSKQPTIIFNDKGASTAMIYYFGEECELRLSNHRTILLPKSDEVTALVFDLGGATEMCFVGRGGDYTYLRLWLYDVKLRHKGPASKAGPSML